MEKLASLQANGATVESESWSHEWFEMIQNRFSVTSGLLKHGSFPLIGERYVICYEGEIYEFRGRQFIHEQQFKSDVHFALALIEEYGIDQFFADVDFDGTVQVYDKAKDLLYVFVDQLNTRGCFYANYDDRAIVASELPVVDEALRLLNAPDNIPIQLLEGGSCLTISRDGKVTKTTYRAERENVWGGVTFSPSHFSHTVRELKRALVNATASRLPREGKVGVLAGGGVDSSLILATVSSLLRQRGEMDRLRVFTFGSPLLNTPREDNDLKSMAVLCAELGLDWDKHVRVITPEEIEVGIKYLLQTQVYTRMPRLITPDPVRTQVRHTVMMASFLAAIVAAEPDLKVVLSGDAADEMFAGYNSMHWGINEGKELRQRIIEKLYDLPLNDASRVALAGYHGTTAILKRLLVEPELTKLPCDAKTKDELSAKLESRTASETQEELETLGIVGGTLRQTLTTVHPLEIRMPYTSLHVLRVLADAHIDYAVGVIDGKTYRKYLLRMVALDSGVPMEIALRKKVPFNEGGRGLRNSEDDPLENMIASQFLESAEKRESLRRDLPHLVRLGIVDAKAEITQEFINRNVVHLALFNAARQCGLTRLLMGNAFRSSMPDAIYSTVDDKPGYLPPAVLQGPLQGDWC